MSYDQCAKTFLKHYQIHSEIVLSQDVSATTCPPLLKLTLEIRIECLSKTKIGVFVEGSRESQA